MDDYKNSCSKIAKRYIVKKCVISGERYEFYQYSMPVRCEYQRGHKIVKNYLTSKGKREDNLSRARQNVRRIIWSNLSNYTKFLTLTCAETCLEVDGFKNKMHVFFKSMKRQGYELKYIYVLERQLERGKKEGNAGSLHAHIVVFNDEKIPLKVLKKAWPYGRTELKILNGLRWDANYKGYKKGEPVRDIGAYVCKYITKEAAGEFGGHVYAASQGLKNKIERPWQLKVVGDGDLSDGFYPVVIGSEGQDYDVIRNCCKIHYMDSKIVPLTYTDGDKGFQIIDYAQGELK